MQGGWSCETLYPTLSLVQASDKRDYKTVRIFASAKNAGGILTKGLERVYKTESKTGERQKPTV